MTAIASALELGIAPIYLPDGREVWIRKASFASQATASRDLTALARQLTTDPSTVSLGPGSSMPAAHPEEIEPRRWAYAPGLNLRNTPRSSESITFDMLKAMANNYDVARLVIEHRKNEFRGLKWKVQPKPIEGMEREAAKARKADLEPQIEQATTFFKKPNQEDFWSVWLGQWLENLFVIDAPTVYLRPRRDGGLFGADVIDGATIRPLIDVYGRLPQPPDFAFGQIIFGQVWGQYTTEELLYTPYWQRPDSLYGHPPLEWIIVAVNRALRRQSIDLTMFTEGTLPAAFYRLPEGWAGAQIAELQEIYDGILAGNEINRSRVRFVPGGPGSGLDQIHPEPKTEVEEWLLHITCAALGAKPTDIGFQPRGAGLGGKGFAEAQADANQHASVLPVADHIKGVCDLILERNGMGELELIFPELVKVEDIYKRAQADQIYLETGKVSVDELRERDDQDPIGLGPYIAGNVTLVEDVLNPPDPVVSIDPVTGAPLQMPFGMTKPGSEPAAADKTDDAKDEPKGKGSDGPPMAKVAGELAAWERKSIKAVKAGRPALVQFTTNAVPAELGLAVDRYLAKASSVAGVRDAFRLAKAGASADPFASSSSASSAISGPTTSPSSGAGFWTGSASGRRPYP